MKIYFYFLIILQERTVVVFVHLFLALYLSNIAHFGRFESKYYRIMNCWKWHCSECWKKKEQKWGHHRHFPTIWFDAFIKHIALRWSVIVLFSSRCPSSSTKVPIGRSRSTHWSVILINFSPRHSTLSDISGSNLRRLFHMKLELHSPDLSSSSGRPALYATDA